MSSYPISLTASRTSAHNAGETSAGADAERDDQPLFGRATADPSDGRTGDARRSAQAQAAADQGRHIASRQAGDRLDGRPQQPWRVPRPVDDREAAVHQLSGHWRRGLRGSPGPQQRRCPPRTGRGCRGRRRHDPARARIPGPVAWEDDPPEIRRRNTRTRARIGPYRRVPGRAVPQLQDHERLIRPVFVRQALLVGPIEAESSIIGRLAQQDHEAVAGALARRQTLADETAADPPALMIREHGERCQADADPFRRPRHRSARG